MKYLLAVLSLTILSGCAEYSNYRAERRLNLELRTTVLNAMQNHEPCNIVCGKLRKIYDQYTDSIE